MASRTRLFFGVLALAVMAGACDIKSCETTPWGPSCYDPDKPIDRDNRPPGPGHGVRASVASYGVYEGDCVENTSLCSQKLTPVGDPGLQMEGVDETYIFKNHQQVYTMHLCVNHPEVPGRDLFMRVNGRIGYEWSTSFNEGENPSPVCGGVAFNMTVPGRGVFNSLSGNRMYFIEGKQDLFEGTVWEIRLGFKVIR